VRVTRAGKGESDFIEESLRRALGVDLPDRPWSASRLGEDEAMDLAVEAQLEVRRSAARGVKSRNSSPPPTTGFG